ncbi:MAG TPA: vitamin K epoxide reductase family protein [Streptosporangiaceae bacterium]
MTALMLSVIGLADSSYQVYTHFSGTGLLGCSSKGDPCALVQSSSYAWIFGIPVAVLGAAFYLAMVVICSPLGWRSQWPAVAWGRLGAVIVGMIFVLYLIYREIVSIGAVCPYCTSVHIITFLLFALIVFAATGAVRTPTAAPRDANVA